jgi:hypothetical protein
MLKERLEALVIRLLNTKNLAEAQAVALELQWAVYEYIEQFRQDVPPQSPNS